MELSEKSTSLRRCVSEESERRREDPGDLEEVQSPRSTLWSWNVGGRAVQRCELFTLARLKAGHAEVEEGRASSALTFLFRLFSRTEGFASTSKST